MATCIGSNFSFFCWGNQVQVNIGLVLKFHLMAHLLARFASTGTHISQMKIPPILSTRPSQHIDPQAALNFRWCFAEQTEETDEKAQKGFSYWLLNTTRKQFRFSRQHLPCGLFELTDQLFGRTVRKRFCRLPRLTLIVSSK